MFATHMVWCVQSLGKAFGLSDWCDWYLTKAKQTHPSPLLHQELQTPNLCPHRVKVIQGHTFQVKFVSRLGFFFLVVILLRFGLFFFLLFNSFMKILVSPKTEKKGRYWNEGKNVKSTQLMLWRSAWKHENQNHALMNVRCGPHGTDVADRWTFWLREWSPFYSHNRGA